MNDERPYEFEIMQAIRDWMARWREWDALIEDVQKQTADLAEDDVISLFLIFSETLLMSLEACRTRILNRYGIVIGQSGLEVTESARGMGLKEEGVRALVEDVTEYAFWAALEHEMVVTMQEAEARGATQPEMWRTAMEAVWGAWLDIQIRILGGAMLAAPFEDQRLAATQGFSGWAHGEIKLFPRIRDALRVHGMDPAIARLLSLPASVLIAWDRAQPDEPLRGDDSVISRVVQQLIAPGVEDAVQSEDLEWVPGQDDYVERVHDREQIARLAERAGLSPRETEVFQLVLRDTSEKQRAAELRAKNGTVKTLKYRLMQKLKSAAEIESDG